MMALAKAFNKKVFTKSIRLAFKSIAHNGDTS